MVDALLQPQSSMRPFLPAGTVMISVPAVPAGPVDAIWMGSPAADPDNLVISFDG